MWRITWIEKPGGLQSLGFKELDTTVRLSTAQHTEAHKMLDTMKKLSSTVTWNHLAY